MPLLTWIARPVFMIASTAIIVAGWQLCARIPDQTTPVDILDPLIQKRFGDARTFGMSRIVVQPSVGRPYRPHPTAARDFEPESALEARDLALVERSGWQVGFYTFGAAATTEPAAAKSYRALKGPAVLTRNTDRANLPVWDAVYPLARKAMADFEAGRTTQQVARINGWNVVLRPVNASAPDCVSCHNEGIGSKLGKRPPAKPYKIGDVFGGVAYAYKPAK